MCFYYGQLNPCVLEIKSKGKKGSARPRSPATSVEGSVAPTLELTGDSASEFPINSRVGEPIGIPDTSTEIAGVLRGYLRLQSSGVANWRPQPPN
ncbi:hypothetical protein CRG98_045592 [Punica granatum]|uniref:Uncharacterized protein n=1 Tax=Punica granatum TaxID=22663 RepID=A0A2I0HQN2_PUNGR|nr:hypothetical protein CRG98_045592 [Punica granatum]